MNLKGGPEARASASLCLPPGFSSALAVSYQKNSEYNRRLGEPEPTLLILLSEALLTIALRTVVDEADGLACL